MSTDAPATAAVRYAVLVPVKPTAVAKSRLAVLGDGPRSELAAAFAVDTVAAVLACTLVERVLVVTDDLVLARGVSGPRVDVLPDGTSDLNGTLVQAAAEMHRRHPRLGLAALCSDLPALRPDELGRVLGAAAPSRMSFVADQEREGTTTVAAPDLDLFRPQFGLHSRAEHLAAGACEIEGLDVPGLRRDVDRPADLAEALDLGVGPHTARVSAGLRL